MLSLLQNLIPTRPLSPSLSRKRKRSTYSKSSPFSSTTGLTTDTSDSDFHTTTTEIRENDISAFLALADDENTKRRKVMKCARTADGVVIQCGRLSTIMEGDEERSPLMEEAEAEVEDVEMVDVDL